jgi:D-alanine-D-alanine ligase
VNEKKRQSAAATPRTLGPVADLEHHLSPEWWRSLFGAVYLRTDGDVVEDNALTRAEIDAAVRHLDLSKDARILDLCCGQGRHTLELARRGFRNVVGIDRSRYLVRLARRRAAREGLQARFHEGDARRIGSRREHFDAVLLLGNSFGYFDKADDDLKVLQGVRNILEPGGQVLLDVTDGTWMRTHFEPRSWEWIDQTQFVCRERSLTADQSRLVTREVVVHSEQGVLVDQFYAERLYDLEGFLTLLARAEFERIEPREKLETKSERGQDLGMMAHRICITAHRPLAPRIVPGKTPKVTCTVLLGDPRLPDTVKLHGAYGKEDLATVQKLKDALTEIPDMHFRFVDDHAAAFEAFRRDPPALVLNLCDEGYQNDAAKELHVPAYLEMLKVPYTGSGPACLAMCYDKQVVRALATQLDIPVPVETSILPGDSTGTIPAVFPALLKPACGDSSVGITQRSVVSTPQEAVEAHTRLSRDFPGIPILVQEYLTGNEYSVGLIGNPGFGYRVLPLLRVDYSGLPKELPQILSYESKWDPESPYWTSIRYVHATERSDAVSDLISHSTKLFERLGCRDYARFDFRADAQGVIKLLEVNPNPGWCWDGKLNLMAGFDGASYSDMLRWILEASTQRIGAANGMIKN